LANIHSTAIVEKGAELADNVSVGPYCVVGRRARLAPGVRLHSHVIVEGDTAVGEGTEVFPFAVLGMPPQHTSYHSDKTRLEIGEACIIREHVTIHRGTEEGGGMTQIGRQCFFMAGSHVAHDCHLGDHVILVNNSATGGHCTIGAYAILGGLSAVHQFARIGEHAFVGGMSGVENDVIPFGSVLGNRAHLAGLNIVGLKRRGFSRQAIHDLRRAYRLLFANEGTLKERLRDVDAEFREDENVQKIVAFIHEGGDRRLCTPRNGRDG
jgi:UDP-N-acetylglucosamine acyltransferase